MTIGHFAIQELRGVHWRYEDDNVAKPHTICCPLSDPWTFVCKDHVWPPSSSLFWCRPYPRLRCAILYTSLTGSVVVASFARVRTIHALGSDWINTAIYEGDRLTATLTCLRLGLASGGAAFAGGGGRPRCMMNKPCMNDGWIRENTPAGCPWSCRGLTAERHPEAADKQKGVERSHRYKAEVGMALLQALQMCVVSREFTINRSYLRWMTKYFCGHQLSSSAFHLSEGSPLRTGKGKQMVWPCSSPSDTCYSGSWKRSSNVTAKR